MKKKFAPIPEYLNDIGKEIVDAALTVHKEMGPGLLESVYEECMEFELKSRGLEVRRQAEVPIEFKGNRLGTPLRCDMLVEDSVIIELKSVETVHPIFVTKMMRYLRLTNLRLGYLVNFNVVLIKDGIKRYVM